mmetsp:Transcript_103281/g.220919  ORF Transcript_103281/g.220919 Transcript_103281/m.220919 type:complete len:238 (-) Transcript_103281:109-822(-)
MAFSAILLVIATGLLWALAVRLYTKEWYAASRIILCVLGFYWIMAATWVEALLNIWYPDASWLAPPKFEQDTRPGHYEPWCDVSLVVKCSTVVLSPWDRLLQFYGLSEFGGALDFANTFFGFPFYLLHVVVALMGLAQRNEKKPQYHYHYGRYEEDQSCDCISLHRIMSTTTAIVCILDVYHALRVCFVIKVVSIIHWGIYLVNFALLPVSLKELKDWEKEDPTKKKVKEVKDEKDD